MSRTEIHIVGSDEQKTAGLFALYSLPLPKQALARNGEEALAFLRRQGHFSVAFDLARRPQPLDRLAEILAHG